ncbi:MAG: hypothetical protein M3396_03225 [Actinomycetota bacterium]|nr:hypothetical protein [Actinomycetota bacterium]MDQ3575687.1 hypothetical protein [Actinomycetota bacterium]
MVAFISSLLITALMCLIVFAVGRTRPPGKALTWGEAIVAATFVFTLLLLIYGIVPNQWLLWADNELGWRKDAFGLPNPFGKSFFEGGIAFGGRGRILISKEAIRDVIAAGIYVVALGGQIAAWKWWQSRAEPTASSDVERSAYGRPLIRKV